MEEWKPISQKPEYEISSHGRVRRGERILKNTLRGKYYELKLGRGNTYRIHRLVAEAFLPNPENKPCVDHIDRNSLNNCVDNLRWATYIQNGMNRGSQINNKLGVKNVSWKKDKQKYRVQVQHTFIAYCDTLEEAIQARDDFISRREV